MYREIRVLISSFCVLNFTLLECGYFLRVPTFPTKFNRTVPYYSTLFSELSRHCRHAVFTTIARASSSVSPPRLFKLCSMLPHLPNYRSCLLCTHTRAQTHNYMFVLFYYKALALKWSNVSTCFFFTREIPLCVTESQCIKQSHRRLGFINFIHGYMIRL